MIFEVFPPISAVAVEIVDARSTRPKHSLPHDPSPRSVTSSVNLRLWPIEFLRAVATHLQMCNDTRGMLLCYGVGFARTQCGQQAACFGATPHHFWLLWGPQHHSKVCFLTNALNTPHVWALNRSHVWALNRAHVWASFCLLSHLVEIICPRSFA